MRLLASCLLTCALFTGCASRDNYLVNRAADFSDILRLSLTAGLGFSAKVEGTRLIQVGGAYLHNVYAMGWHNRAIGIWRESVRSWGLIVGYHKEEVDTIGAYSGSYGWRFSDGGMSFQPANDGNFDLDLLTCRAELHLIIIGIDVEARIGEVLDFVAGIFQFDPAGDDRDYESMRKPEGEEESEPAESTAEPAKTGS